MMTYRDSQQSCNADGEEKMATKSKHYNWAALKSEFIAENIESPAGVGLKEFAESHSIIWGTLRNHAGKNHWLKELSIKLEQHHAGLQAQSRRRNEDALNKLSRKFANDEYQVRAKHAERGRMMQERGMKRIESVSSEDLSARDAMQMLKIGMEMERNALGFSDKVALSSLEPTNEEREPGSPITMHGADRMLLEILDKMKNDDGEKQH